MSADRSQCFCAYCKSPRRIFRARGLTAVHVLGCLIFSAAISMWFRSIFDVFFLVLFASFAVIAEVVLRLRWRMSIQCEVCGFDPALYVQSQEKAAEKVKSFYEKKKLDPLFLLKSHPAIEARVNKRRQARLNSMDL